MNLLTGIQQDFHRTLNSPGAYEWWHFDGTDEKSGFSFALRFSAGNLFSAYYQDSLKAYWEKTGSPLAEKSPAPDSIAASPPNPPAVSPPNPLDYCGVAFRLFRRGRKAGEGLQEFSSRHFRASDRDGAVLLGPNRFNWDGRSDPPSYVVTAQAPLGGGRRLLRARLFFTPLLPEVPAPPSPEIPSTHTWVLAAPLCRVEGTFQWCDAKGEALREEPFVGRGYHDHHFGSVPPARFTESWHWGRAFQGDGVLVYSLRVPAGGAEPPEGFLLSAGGAGTRFWKGPFRPLRKRRNIFWLPYHRSLESDGDPFFRADHRRILSDGPASLVFEDEVRWRRDGKDLAAPGLSQYLYPPRLSNPLFFPMLKGQTSVFSRPSPDSPADLPSGPGDVTTTRPPL